MLFPPLASQYCSLQRLTLRGNFASPLRTEYQLCLVQYGERATRVQRFVSIDNIRILRTLNIRYNLSSSRCRMALHAWANPCMRTRKREYSLRHKLQPLHSSKHSSLFVVTSQTHHWASRSAVVDRGPQRARVQEGHYD